MKLAPLEPVEDRDVDCPRLQRVVGVAAAVIIGRGLTVISIEADQEGIPPVVTLLRYHVVTAKDPGV